MSQPQEPDPAKLVVGLFLRDINLIEAVAGKLVGLFGKVDLVSNWLDFDYTNYYTSEFGGPLFRRVFSFSRLISQDDLAAVKLATNEIEQSFSEDKKRMVNIDPGYLLRERFVLATGKNFAHRIHLDQGIYADLTLLYQKKEFRTLPWTYPDYADKSMLLFLEQVRERYLLDIKR